ncbi:acyltransferase [Roseomonas mucosa]
MNISGHKDRNLVVGTFESDSAVTVQFSGTDNELTIGPNVIFRSGIINFRGHGQKVHLMGNNVLQGEIHLSGHRSKVIVGQGTKVNSAIWMNLGEADDIIEIGDNCLFANVRFRTSDSHPIYDQNSGDRINHSRPIKIGNKVWIAEDVLILKGAHVRDGSAIGARSLVAGDIPENCIAVGVPARVVRHGIRWEEKFQR